MYYTWSIKCKDFHFFKKQERKIREKWESGGPLGQRPTTQSRPELSTGKALNRCNPNRGWQVREMALVFISGAAHQALCCEEAGWTLSSSTSWCSSYSYHKGNAFFLSIFFPFTDLLMMRWANTHLHELGRNRHNTFASPDNPTVLCMCCFWRWGGEIMECDQAPVPYV